MKGGDGIFSNILMKSRSSKLFKKRPQVQSATRTAATTTLQAGWAQSINGSDSTLSSVHTGSMTGYAGNLSPPVIIPLHVLMHEDDDADSVSLVTAKDRSRRSSVRDENGGLFAKTTTKKKTTTTTNGRRRQAKKCGEEAGCECKPHQQRRPTTNRKKMTETRRRKSVQKSSSSSMHFSTVPSTETRQDNNIGKTSINIARMDSSNGSAVECMYTDAFVIDTFRNRGSICSSSSSCSTNSGDEE